MFQSYNLVPSLSGADNITLPLRLAGRAPDHQWLRTRSSPTAREEPGHEQS